MSSKNSNQKILIIDDEQHIRDMLKNTLQTAGYLPETATDGLEGAAKLEKACNAGTPYRFVLCDVKMPVMDGLQFLAGVKDKLDRTTVIMMSAHGNVETAVAAMKLGAYDYIAKPFEEDELLLVLEKANEVDQLKDENISLKKRIKEIEGKQNRPEITTRCPAMEEVYKLATKAAKFQTTVLITGESGTGKERIAQSIHSQSDRAGKPLVTVNCGGRPENLMDSEFFGYKKGAFTDAKQDRIGLFEEADGGTIFLDEIGELPPPMQVKLLRVLQENEIRPVGGVKTRKIDVRILAATARNLIAEAGKGTFRQDLFYRLNVLNIVLPPLRERKEDIPLLCQHFLEIYSQRLRREVKLISPEAMNLLLDYSWPGNIRELENMIERAIVLAHGDTLQIQDFPDGLLTPSTSGANKIQTCNAGNQDTNTFSLKKAKVELEIKMITRALKSTHGNRTHAARLLEISHPSLLSKIKTYGIEI